VAGVRGFSAGGAIDGYEPLEAAMEAQPPTPLDEERISGRDMLYSSGTTGRPKGIKPTEVAEPLGTPHKLTPVLQAVLGMSDASVYLSPAPNYHAAPLRFTMTAQQIGATVVMMERFEVEAALDAIRRYGVTHTQMVPTMFVRLLRADPAVRAAADVSTLEAVVHAGAPCPPDVKRAMIEWLGPILHEYYGATEGAGLTWVTSQEWLAHQGTVGRAVIGRVRIVAEDDGRELGPGETGRVFFSDGPEFEYHNDAAKTAEAHNAQGWAQCGDIGHLDADGYLYLTDRASFTIITGGVNVYPQEAEDVLISHPKVMDAAVFGIPNEVFGEEVKAVVQPVEPPADAAALEAELIAHCRSRLADVKCPRSIDFRAELPRHDTGKLYKRQLKEEYSA
jgi:acyl-CoA synthetase (AMP-forming)/AMP-acid ligase II